MTYADELRGRTRRFAFSIVNLVRCLPAHSGFDAIWRQLLRAGTGVATSHRACGRARSTREFIARLGLVVEEADETEFWLETMIECRLAPESIVAPLYREARELRAIFSAALATARRNQAARAAGSSTPG